MTAGIRTRGNSIQIDFTYQGVRCRETLKIAPSKTNLKYAERKRETILYEIETGRFDYLQHFPQSKKGRSLSSKVAHHITVEEALKSWLRRAERRCARSTIRDYGSAIYHHLIPAFGHFTLNQIKPTDIREWIDTLDISNKRINNVLTPLRLTLGEAYAEEIIDRNPMDRIRNLPKRIREPRPFNRDEIARILMQLEGQARNLFQFAFATGLRTSELIALDWKDINLEQGKLYVHQAVVRGVIKQTKTESGQRVIDILSDAKTALLRQQQITGPTGQVFTDPACPSLPLDDQKIRKRLWTPALARACVDYREPYQTRHTFASTQLSEGRNPLWVASQMGHKDWGMVRKVYGRWIPNNTEVV